ncbi:hypothetical protein L1987_23296 [Smallanthus sonchifolius]|uniref:Uncharacterized protein n=1 Tax=Smallanthus sonchifolius TaxID=185202 RepID=A0ACB9IGI8_9ASTR|nr:hypothetical protein L1987_23296 [Smallanthus sonchifolius]
MLLTRSKILSGSICHCPINTKQQTQLLWKQHCVLVTASHPSPDAETLGTSFIESFVSLSVICPRDMPTIRTVYDAFQEALEALEKFTAENNNNTDLEQDSLVSCDKYDGIGELLNGSTLYKYIGSEFSPLEAISDLGNNSIIQQGMQTDYVQDQVNVAGGSNQIIPEEMEQFQTLNSRDISPFQVGFPNFAEHSNNFNINKQKAMENLSGSQVQISEGTATSSANIPSHRSIPKPINTFHLSTSWLLKNNPENILKTSYSNMLTPRTDALSAENFSSFNRLTTSENTCGTKYVSSTNMQPICVDISYGKMEVCSPKKRIARMSNPTTKHVISTNNEHIASINNNGTNNLLTTKAPTSSTNHFVTSRVIDGSSCGSSCHVKEPHFPTTPLLSSDRILPRNFSSEVPYGHIKAWEGSITSRDQDYSLDLPCGTLLRLRNLLMSEWLRRTIWTVAQALEFRRQDSVSEIVAEVVVRDSDQGLPHPESHYSLSDQGSYFYPQCP